MFQPNAASTAQSTVVIVTTSVSTNPLPIVAATAPPNNAPVRLKNAAIAIAWRGVIACEKITKPLHFELVGIAFDALELGVHLARGAGVDPWAQLLYHGQHHFGGLIEQLNLLTKTLAGQIFGAD